ncbi:MAG TPA: site-specific DNA-methyltransferase [Kofleriaceae bacterium]|nr:site-specific DNA-methyltransferase [Kofleriaceae bacterium]
MNRAAAPMPSRLTFGAGAEPPDRLIAQDSLSTLAATATGSIDLIYVDPPFATGRMRQGRGHRYADAPDDPEAYTAWLVPYLAEMRRVLAAHGSAFIHLDYRAAHYVKVALDRVFGRARFINEIVWCYSVGGKSQRSFAKKHDTILWYGRTADHAFFPNQVRVPKKPGSHMRVVRDESGALVQEKTCRATGKVYRYPVAAGKVPEDWWTDIETLNHSAGERTGWPTQKPERLLARIVSAASRPGDRVADFFSGSGTTAVIAQRLGRRFIAGDREPAAIAVAARRLAGQGLNLAKAGSPPPDIEVTVALPGRASAPKSLTWLDNRSSDVGKLS